jgi:hypothetical protein
MIISRKVQKPRALDILTNRNSVSVVMAAIMTLYFFSLLLSNFKIKPQYLSSSPLVNFFHRKIFEYLLPMKEKHIKV